MKLDVFFKFQPDLDSVSELNIALLSCFAKPYYVLNAS